MFIEAKKLSGNVAVRKAVEDEIDGLVARRVFRMTDVLNEPEPLRMYALERLHGRTKKMTGTPTVTLRVSNRITKPQYVPDDNPRYTRAEVVVLAEPGEQTYSTDAAVYLLWNYGKGVRRVRLQPERSRREWVEEVSPSASPTVREPAARAAAAR